jgi:hypothetical protein
MRLGLLLIAFVLIAGCDKTIHEVTFHQGSGAAHHGITLAR